MSGLSLPPARAQERAVDTSFVDVVLHPERFFPEGARRLSGGLLVLLILALGAARSIDRLEVQAIGAAFTSDTLKLAESWAIYWGTVLVGCLLAGPLNYFLFGWWYRMRLRFSGAKQADARLVRRVHLVVSLVEVFPTIALTALDTWRYATPTAAWHGGEPIPMSLVVAPLWSVWVSYQVAVTSFPVSRERARIWFAILPGLWFSVLFLGSGLLGASLIG